MLVFIMIIQSIALILHRLFKTPMKSRCKNTNKRRNKRSFKHKKKEDMKESASNTDCVWMVDLAKDLFKSGFDSRQVADFLESTYGLSNDSALRIAMLAIFRDALMDVVNK